MSITLAQACQGVLIAKRADGRSPSTICVYENAYRVLCSRLGGETIFDDSLTYDRIAAFFAWLRDEYETKPGGVASRGRFKLGDCSIFNIRSALSVLWTWGIEEGFVSKNVIKRLKISHPKEPIIESFTKTEVEAMLKACEYTAGWSRYPGARSSRPTCDRDKAIIYTLLSTGIRATELCNIKIRDVNLAQSNIHITLGKGKKPRLVFFGKRASRVLWRQINTRQTSGAGQDDLLFINVNDEPLNRDSLKTLINRIGARANVPRTFPHRFRHTFAINYLRNDGDLLTLQALLGHSSLEMVRRYARIVAADCANVHKRADPVDNWRI